MASEPAVPIQPPTLSITSAAAAATAKVVSPSKASKAITPEKVVLPPAVYSPELLESVIYEIEQYVAWFRDNRIKTKVGGALAPEPVHSAETRQVIELWAARRPLTS